jgi:hypothetical protein
MPIMVAALLLVAAVAVTNLVLTLGVVSRLREHAAQLAAGARPGPSEMLLGAGERPGDFSARTVADGTVSARSLAAPALVGFFSPTCSACTEWIPRFVSAAESLPGGATQALAVVVSTADTTTEVAELRRVAQVVVEPIDGPVARAFRVRGFPALCRLGTDGTVHSSDNWTAVSPWVQRDRVA